MNEALDEPVGGGVVGGRLSLFYADGVEEMLTDVTQDRDRRSDHNLGGRKCELWQRVCDSTKSGLARFRLLGNS